MLKEGNLKGRSNSFCSGFEARTPALANNAALGTLE